jgi:hypothetical protein
MTLLLSGTDGLSDVDGSAATPAIRGTDANTGIFFPAADTIAFSEGGAEVARFDSAGNLLVGTTTTGSVGISLSSTYNLGWPQSSGESVPNIFRQVSSAATVMANGYRNSATSNGFASSFSSSYAKTAISCGTVSGGITFYTDTATTVAAGTDVTPTERMRIDSLGNVGIGITPSPWSTSNSTKAIQISSRGSIWANVNSTSINNNWYLASGDVNTYINTAAATRYVQDATGIHQWFYAPSGTAGATMTLTEAMRLDTSGNLIMASRSGGGNIGQLRVGTTESTGSANGYAVFVGSSSTPYPMVVKGLSNDQGLIGFVSSSDVVIGSITKSVSATQYNTSSDYRLKDNITPMTNALGVVQQLKPVTYNWKVDGSAGQGFIAHELQEVVPDCVTGEKDAVETYLNEDGVEQTRPKYQGIDTSFLVATLTAAIQEQQALIQQLQADVAALKGV